MAPPALTGYEYCFGDSGFILNADSTQLPFLDVTNITGLDGAPLRTNTTEREGVDGTYVDAAQTSLRTIVITGTLYTDPNDPDTVCDLLCSQYGPGPIQPFYYQHPGKALKFILAQGGGCQYSIDTSRRIGQTPIQLTLLAGNDYKYDYPPQNVTTPALAAIAAQPLNSNTGFEVNTVGWNSLSSATLAQSSAAAFAGNGSMLVTPNGTNAQPGALTAAFPVVPGNFYTATAMVFSPSGWAGGASAGLRWFDINGAVITTASASTGLLVGNNWTNVTVSDNAPSNAVTGKMLVWTNGTPPSSVLSYWDECYFLQDAGMGFPFGFPLGFGPTQSIPAATVSNSGTRTAYPVLTLNGPLTGPSIRDSQSDLVMSLNVSLGSTDTLVIDCYNKSILLNGQSRRSSYQGLQWFTVPTGVADTFFLSANGGNGVMTITLYNTYN